MITRIAVITLFVALLAAPLLFRTDRTPPPENGRQLIIITPHNEQIRSEFARGFPAWLKDHPDPAYREEVSVVFSVPGGTSEIRKMLQAQYEAALKKDDPLGGNADLVFGGGSYEHGQLKRGVRVTVDGEERTTSISAPVEFDAAWLDATYGENAIGNLTLYDPDQYWFGTALSGFGIVYNRDALAHIKVPEPETWDDLCHPRLRGWLALVNPAQSGSITTAFEAILHRLGWERGWQVLRRAGANARYFSASSLKPPTDVSQGDAAMGVSIDFYGRYQAQAMRVAGDSDRVGYVDPPGVSTIDPDPVSMLSGAREPDLARRFIEYTLSVEAQALWQFKADDPASEEDGLGPYEFELRRLPVRRSMYRDHFDRLIDQVNPFEIAAPADEPNRNVRSFIAPIFRAMIMENHEQLREAWTAIVEHPAYPEIGSGRAVLVTADDVTDPELRTMLERFDAMPTVPGPDGETYSLATDADLGAIKAGWLRDGFRGKGLWPKEAEGDDIFRLNCARFFRAHMESIVEGAGHAPPANASATLTVEK